MAIAGEREWWASIPLGAYHSMAIVARLLSGAQLLAGKQDSFPCGVIDVRHGDELLLTWKPQDPEMLAGTEIMGLVLFGDGEYFIPLNTPSSSNSWPKVFRLVCDPTALQLA